MDAQETSQSRVTKLTKGRQTV